MFSIFMLISFAWLLCVILWMSRHDNQVSSKQFTLYVSACIYILHSFMHHIFTLICLKEVTKLVRILY